MSQFSSDEESDKEYDYDPPVGAFPVIEPDPETSVIPSADNTSESMKVDTFIDSTIHSTETKDSSQSHVQNHEEHKDDYDNTSADSIAMESSAIMQSADRGTEVSTDEIDRLAAEVLYPIPGLERVSDKKIVYTLVGEEITPEASASVDKEIIADPTIESASEILDDLPTDAIVRNERSESTPAKEENPAVKFAEAAPEISESISLESDTISTADRLTDETVRAFMDARTTAISQQSAVNPISESFAQAETEAFGAAPKVEVEPPTTVLSTASGVITHRDAETAAQSEQRENQAIIASAGAEQASPSSRDLAVASYFDALDPAENPGSSPKGPATESNNPSTRDLAVASYFEDDILSSSVANISSPGMDDPIDGFPISSIADVENEANIHDQEYPYLITAEIMAKLRSKAQRYRPILLEVNNLLSEQSLPGHLSPETAKLMHSVAAERTASQMIIPQEELGVQSQPFSSRIPSQTAENTIMRPWVALTSTIALFLAIFVVLVNVLICMINFVDGTILGISLGNDAHAWASIFGAAHMTLFPPSPLSPGDAVLVIFAYPLVMCITLVVARYLVFTFGARNIFMLSALAFSIIGYIISRVGSLTVAGYLLGTWGAAGSFMLVSALYLLNRLRSGTRFQQYMRSCTVVFFLLLIPLAGLLFWIVQMSYLVSIVLAVISFLAIFNINSNNYRDMPISEGKDIIGTILFIVLIGILGWTFIEGEYWQLVETAKIWAYLLALVVFIAFLIYEYISPQSFFSLHRSPGTLSSIVDYLITGIGSLLWNFAIFLIAFYIASWNQLNLKNVSLKILPLFLGILLGIFLINALIHRIPAAIMRSCGFISIALAIAWFMRITQYTAESELIFLSEIFLFLGGVLILGNFIRMESRNIYQLSLQMRERPSLLGLFFIQFFGLIFGLIIPALILIQKRSEMLFASSQNSASTIPLTITLGGKKISGEVLNIYASGNVIHDVLYVPLCIAGIGLLIAVISLGFSQKKTVEPIIR